MIGSLLYYGLYPLTQLFIKLSGAFWKRNLVIVNGKAVCDDGAGSCKRLNEQQTAWLDQWCIAGTGAGKNSSHTLRESSKGEGLADSRSIFKVREAVVEKKSELEQDKEKIHSVDLMDPNPESVLEYEEASMSEWAKIPTAADESGRQRFQVMMSETGSVCPAGGDLCRLGYSGTLTHSSSDNHDLFKSPQESKACMIRKQTADGAKEKNAESKVPVQLTSGLFTSENVYGSDLGTVGSQAQVSNGGLVYDLGALLTDNHEQSFTNHTWLQPAHTQWQFPVGFGLSEVRQPLQFPCRSYYNGYQENTNFEVIWRVWEDLCKTSTPSISPHATCVGPGSKFDFTVMSYNILAQDLLEANLELYAHCSENVLAWENRLQTILKELQTYKPDIICLQEVQENHYQERIYPALIEMGYDCIYKRRTGDKPDGCAVCYDTTRFTSLSVRLLEFQRHDCELLDRDNVGIVLLLQPNPTHGEGVRFRPICVANTHLLFNPRRGDVKLAQLAIVLAEIHSVVRQYKVKGHECEIILCGDFNSLPNTPLYELIVTGQLYYHGLPCWMVSGQEDLSYKTYPRRLYAPLWPNSLGINDNCQYYDACEPMEKKSEKLQYNHDFLRQLRYCPASCVRPSDLELIPGVTDNTPICKKSVHTYSVPALEESGPFPPRHFRNTICHGLNLSSVYNQNITDTERYAVTTLNSHGAAMVDYIFYSKRRRHDGGCDDKEKGLKLLGRLSQPSEADLWLLNGLPNEIFPSDHLGLFAKFQLC